VTQESNLQEELRKLSVELRLLEQTAETYQSRLNMMNAALTDLTYANMTLEGVEKEKEKAELLVPIGGGSYIKVKLGNPDKIVVGMGSGVSVEKSLGEAKSVIKERLEGLEKSRLSVQQQLAQVADRINKDRRRMDRLVASLREGNAPSNV
jgi:prefoldin alpha subunit